jgi:heme-degrading monooxygenase HmoA
MDPLTTLHSRHQSQEEHDAVIARIWRGATRPEDAGEYAEYVRATGLKGYQSTPGNLGAWVLWRVVGDRAEVVTFSLWESREAIRGFAGDDISRAVFYPEDDRWLIDRELTVEHYEVGTYP